MNWNEEIRLGEIEDTKSNIDRLKDRMDDLKKERVKSETNIEKEKENIRGIDGLIKEKQKELTKAIEKLAELNQ